MKRLNAPLIFTFASILLLFQSCGDKSIKPEVQEDISYLKNKLKREIFSRAGDVTADYTYTNYNNVVQLEKVLFNEGGEVKKSTTYEVPSPTNRTFFRTIICMMLQGVVCTAERTNSITLDS